MKKYLLFIGLLFISFALFAQEKNLSYSVGLELGASYINKIDVPRENYVFYDFLHKPLYGIHFQAAYAKIKFFTPFARLGIKKVGFEGRHYEQTFVEVINNLEYYPRQEFWSTFQMYHSFLMTGMKINLPNVISVGGGIEAHYIMKVIEKRQEVHLYDTYGRNVFFEPTNQTYKDFKPFFLSYYVFLEHPINKHIHITLNAAFSFTSMTRRFETNYHWRLNQFSSTIHYIF